jgi:hypothetical protein
LNQSTPITKKDACGILNISYNTTRLTKIIEDHEDTLAFRAKRTSQNRGKPATQAEIADAITSYLQGDSVIQIAKSLYRSAGLIKAIIERIGVPYRPGTLESKNEIGMFPDECMSDEFETGEIVWSAEHHCAATVQFEYSLEHTRKMPGLVEKDYEAIYGGKLYSIWVMRELIDDSSGHWIDLEGQRNGFFGCALAYDLGRLTHLEQYGIDLSRI